MDIREYLKKVGKKDISELTKREASELIQILLRTPVEYVFPCGKRKFLHKQEVNRINIFSGSFEACIHHCPEELDVDSCLYWKGYYDGLKEEFLSDEVVDEIYRERYRIKCAFVTNILSKINGYTI